MLPLRRDPAAASENAMRSLTRAAIATGLSAIDRGVRHGCRLRARRVGK
jgi:hypothetical protein